VVSSARFRSEWWAFAALAVGLAAVTVASSFNDYLGSSNSTERLIARVAVPLAAGALVFVARVRPLVSFVLLGMVCLAVGWFAPYLYPVQLSFIVVLFIVSWRTSFSLWATGFVGALVLTAMFSLKELRLDRPMDSSLIFDAIVTAALAVGCGAQTRRLRVANERLVELAAIDRHNAVINERRRIATELHDVAAHHLSAVIVKNKLAMRLDNPDELRHANAFATESASTALTSMRQLVGVLSDTDDAAPLGPQPGLTEVAAMTNRLNEAGLTVEVSSLPDEPVGRQVELAAFRIVQEALTNILRHRGPGRAWVSITAVERALHVTIDDDGQPPQPSPRRGHGLIGMEERARACGGRFGIETSPRGGWRIAAVLPVLEAP
jgi:signal transduction histidine kinase